jgi:hypothetical protein
MQDDNIELRPMQEHVMNKPKTSNNKPNKSTADISKYTNRGKLATSYGQNKEQVSISPKQIIISRTSNKTVFNSNNSLIRGPSKICCSRSFLPDSLHLQRNDQPAKHGNAATHHSSEA